MMTCLSFFTSRSSVETREVFLFREGAGTSSSESDISITSEARTTGLVTGWVTGWLTLALEAGLILLAPACKAPTLWVWRVSRAAGITRRNKEAVGVHEMM